MPTDRLDRGFSRNVGTLLLGQVLRVPITAVYFVVATRALGVESFGRLTAVGALIMIAAPFSALGSGALIVKYGATEPQTTRHWLGAGLTLSLLGSLLVGALLLLLSPVLVPVGTGMAVVGGLLVAEFVLARAADLASSVFVAREEMHVTAFCQVLVPTLRLVAAGLLVLSPAEVGLDAWVLALVLSSALSGAICLALAVRAVGRPVLGLATFRGHWREAALFSMGIGVQTAHNDADKVMLGRLDGPVGVGLYGAAYRVVDTAWLPVRAMLGAAWPRIFKHARGGPAEILPFVRAVAGPSLLYSVAAVAAMVAGAALLIPLLGESYRESVPLLRVLAVVLLLRCLHYLPADVLTGVGRQGVRTTIQLVVLAVNVLLNLWLIPQLGVWGAVWATLASEALLAMALWVALILWMREPRPDAPDQEPA
ncbi:lipopolysaccharide biosynthesis protein [Ornithinimicrobium cerasi]|uniref:lipopolysaccharide biosynthesis protein n=1 Tax=Ornithinimicrobium cerasi TaxID=2248773 RepID=UPI000EFE8D00|nr:oligosaccharide flippase family protein [Ornithinimicrobium cerasi]